MYLNTYVLEKMAEQNQKELELINRNAWKWGLNLNTNYKLLSSYLLKNL